MKKSNLLFVLLLWAVVASAQDTVHVTGCTTFWKDGNPVTGAKLLVQIVDPNFPTPPVAYQLDSTQSCLTVAVATNLPPTSKLGITPEKNYNPLNGVTVLDLILISEHILGLNPLPSPYAMIAADANKSGSITSFDIVAFRRLITGIDTVLPNNQSWRFADSKFVFPDPNNPFKTAFPENYMAPDIPSLDGDTLRFVSMKVGDVDGDADLKKRPYPGPTTVDSMAVVLPDTLLPSGLNEVLLPVYMVVPSSASSLRMLQLEFRPTNPAVKIVGMTSGSVLLVNDENYHIFPNGSGRAVLTGVGSSSLNIWDKDKAAFYLRLQVQSLEPILLKNALAINPAAMPCFSSARQPNGTYKSYRLVQRFGSTSSLFSPAANTLRATPASPNPFTDKALVQIELTETTSVLLEVFGLDGRLRWSEEQRLPAGVQELEIPAAAVEPGSMGLYRVRAGSGVATGKVMRLE